MKYSLTSHFSERKEADALLLPFWEEELESHAKELKSVFESGDFKGKLKETLLFYSDAFQESRVLLLGLGKKEKADEESIRKSFGKAALTLRKLKTKTLNLEMPKKSSLKEESLLRGLFEGLLLANYSFSELKSKKAEDTLLEKVRFIGLDQKHKPFLERQIGVFEGVNFTRDLVNKNADEITPDGLSFHARSLEKKSDKIQVTIRDKAWLEKEKMGLILAVSRGSPIDPRLIEVSYKGDPKSKETIVLVGKGVTYDTGGLSLKPSDAMLGMKCDMAGSAAVLGTMRALSELNLPVNVVGLIPTVENSIDGKSYKVGDVYTSYSGKTVEITNTDAEGRLILADALSYAEKNLNPSYMIDLATLTGAVIIALGDRFAGFWSNNETLTKDLKEASKVSSELLWELPLWREYQEDYKSVVADIKNSGKRDASSTKAALFLEEFVGNTKWAHIDIAGTAFWDHPKEYHPAQATGFAVRLLIEYLAKK